MKRKGFAPVAPGDGFHNGAEPGGPRSGTNFRPSRCPEYALSDSEILPDFLPQRDNVITGIDSLDALYREVRPDEPAQPCRR